MHVLFSPETYWSRQFGRRTLWSAYFWPLHSPVRAIMAAFIVMQNLSILCWGKLMSIRAKILGFWLSRCDCVRNLIIINFTQGFLNFEGITGFHYSVEQLCACHEPDEINYLMIKFHLNLCTLHHHSSLHSKLLSIINPRNKFVRF